jgi:methyl-accepting chemotaxis protein
VRTILSDVQRATNAAVLATEQGTKGAEAGAAQVDRTGRAIEELAAVIEQSQRSASRSRPRCASTRSGWSRSRPR